MKNMKKIYLNIDGASRGNPGPASIGVIAYDSDGKVLEKISGNIGKTTNNIAEYNALITGLKLAHKLNAEHVVIRSDSQLVVKQINGEYKIKSKPLQKLAIEVHELIGKFTQIELVHVPRTKNKEADKLANEALDDASGILKKNKPQKNKGKEMQEKSTQNIPSNFSFDDLLILPNYSDVLPHETDLSTRICGDIYLNIPILSAAMDTVTESKMAIALAEQGALGVIHRNMSPENQAAEIATVKRAKSVMIRNPITIAPTITVGKAISIMDENNITGLPVVDGKKLVGILTSRDIRFEPDTSREVSELMTRELVTMQDGEPLEKAAKLLHEYRIEKILVVDKEGHLIGLITARDLQKKKENPNAIVDSEGHLVVAAAIGVGSDMKNRAKLLIEAGADILSIDTAHGDSKNVIDSVAFLKSAYPKILVIAGNVATAGGAKRLAEAGADAIKVGVGPGSICTTRVITGVGAPQASAVSECATVLNKKDIPLISDGGIRYSGDAVKALALGANSIMLGNLLAGTDEAPGETVLLEGRRFKVYRGMGSLGAMKKGARDRYSQEHVINVNKMVPEGIEGRIPYKGPVTEVIYQLAGGIKAGLGMVGAKNLLELRERANFVRITLAGLQESHPHTITISKEAPNYRVR